jgi:hypothetical protein
VSAVLPRPMKGLVILVFCVETNPFEQQNRQHTGRVAPCCLCLLFTFFFLGSSAYERGRASEARGELRKHVFLGSSNIDG